jgi:glycosyltransferase involved in cell wall biosynthesis
MKKILVIGMTTFPGGMERYIINWFEKMNKNIYKTYFLNQEGNQEIAYTDVITQNGGEIVYAIKRNGHFWEHYKEIQKIYKNQFDIIYYNTLDLGNVDFLIMAKLFNKHAKKIVHAHNSSSASKGIRYELIKLHTRYIKNISDIRLACSQVAGDWMFKGADYRVINNSIDLDKFKFDVQKKQEMLDKLGLKGKKVWGTVGRLAKQKNPLFIVEIMRYVHTVDKDVVFVHIGDGQLKSEMQAKIKEYGLEELYLLLG